VRIAAGCILTLLFLSGCGDDAPQADADPQPAAGTIREHAQSSIAPVTGPLAIGPVTFFQNYCARCHGDYGWSFNAGYTAGLRDEELLERVHEMVVGPAQQRLGEREIRALADLHRAIDAGDAGSFAARTADGSIDALPGTKDPEALLEGRGAWAGTDASGRVFGEVDSRE